MRNKRYKAGDVAPADSKYWKCNWLDCAGGMGLAGSGICSFLGEWWKKKCPEFKPNTEFEASCPYCHAPDHDTDTCEQCGRGLK